MEKSLVLRSSNANGTSSSYRLENGKKVSRDPFQWPKSGPVECFDWNPSPVCGGGLHGLLWGEGDWSLLNSDNDALWQVVEVVTESIWQVVEVVTESIVKIDQQKVKFQRGTVIYSGGMAEAITMVLNHQARFKELIAEIKEATNQADRASSGDSSKAASSGRDTIAMAAGRGCAVQAGVNGCFAAAYFDEKAKCNRILVGHVGEDGIKADTPYIINVLDSGVAKWKEVK